MQFFAYFIKLNLKKRNLLLLLPATAATAPTSATAAETPAISPPIVISAATATSLGAVIVTKTWTPATATTLRSLSWRRGGCLLRHHNVFCLRPLCPLGDFKVYFVSFIQGLEFFSFFCLNGRVVNKNVAGSISTFSWRDEAVPFFSIKPFDFSTCHNKNHFLDALATIHSKVRRNIATCS